MAKDLVEEQCRATVACSGMVADNKATLSFSHRSSQSRRWRWEEGEEGEEGEGRGQRRVATRVRLHGGRERT